MQPAPDHDHSERSAFSWPQSAAALAAAIARAQARGDPDRGDTYYHPRLGALEQLVIAKRLGGHEQIHALENAWADAAERTPHGQPITLNDAERALAR